MMAYEGAGKFDKLLPLKREQVERLRAKAGKQDLEFAGELAGLGYLCLESGQFAEAEKHLRECLNIRATGAADHWTTFNTRSMLGWTLHGQKRYADAEPLLREGYEGMRQRVGQIPPAAKDRLTTARERLIQNYVDAGNPTEADRRRAEKID
jgi:uncharacterized protein HemY